MNPQSKKKLQNFKKEIKKEAVDRKKFKIRKQLPYYEEMFRQIDESSNATNSRSSRFPIRACPSKQRSTIFFQPPTHPEPYHQLGNNNPKPHQEQQKTLYLQYLKSINTVFREQDKALIEKYMTQRYGQNCFVDIVNLREGIHCDLLTYEKVLYSDGDEDRLDGIDRITQEDWYFVVASLRFAQNERYEEIERTSFTLITGLFNQWYLHKLMRLIDKHQHNSIETIFAQMKHLQDIEIPLQQHILSTILLQLTCNNNHNLLQPITNYMMDKLRVFQHVERRMLEIFDVEETESFSEIVFNCGFAHCVVVMVRGLEWVDDDELELKMGVYSLTSKYYAMYPVNVGNQQQETEGRFSVFINNYLNNLNTFTKAISHIATGTQITPNSPLLPFITNTQSLLHSLLWKDTPLDNNSSHNILSIYSHLITISLNCDGLIARLWEFGHFHRRMIEFALTFYSFFDGSREFFFRNQEYVQYVSLLIMYLQEAKLRIRYQGCQYLQQQTQGTYVVDNSLKQHLSNLESNLIYALYIISYDIQDTDQIHHQVSKLLQYTEFVYKTEQQTLEEIRNFNILQNINFIFEDNVKLYFRVFLKQDQTRLLEQDSETRCNSGCIQGEVQI